MPRRKSGTFDNKVYQNEYHKAMKTKLISFNPASSDDMELWAWLVEQDNATKYIKNLVREDMEHWKAIEEMNTRTEGIRKELSPIVFPTVDGYRDEEACKECIEQSHTIFVDIIDNWEVRIDADTKKVLTVRDFFGSQINTPDK